MTASVTDVSGIGASTAEALGEQGIKTAEDLANASVERVMAVPGFAKARAERAINAAKAHVSGKPAAVKTVKKKAAPAETASAAKPAAPKSAPSPKDEKLAAKAEKKAKKKDKKGKKKNKGKKKGKK